VSGARCSGECTPLGTGSCVPLLGGELQRLRAEVRFPGIPTQALSHYPRL
jgi:hypothetical protein